MSAAWVAATVRVRALAAGRAGPAGAARVAAAGSLAEVGELFSHWSYGSRVTDPTTPGGLQRATRETLLWQYRVLAGWTPPRETKILRAAAMEFERDNILMRLRELEGGRLESPYALGALDTSWGLVRHAESPEVLRELLAATGWGEAPADGQGQLADVLSATWLATVAREVPVTAPSASRHAALIAARVRFVDLAEPCAELRRRLRPLLGSGWEPVEDLPGFVAALPREAREVFAGVSAPHELWRAESHLYGLMEAEATALLRSGTPSAEVVAAGLALLAADAWRIQAAVAAVESGRAAWEVLDAAS
ncbi:hypothetical protein [Demequina sp.]|uniref:hypothetical protein n=1 Tax=Demequina sp. TaxID=2050685 RepID=UPI0025EA72C5|nr:hypothetical protein [Demequina sp.]